MSFLLPLLVAFSSFSLFADTELLPIEVQASKDIKRFTFSSSKTISSEEIEREATSLSTNSLEKIPGLVLVQDGGPGARASFFIRGTESRHISVTIDGLKMNDTSSNDRQFNAAFLLAPFIQEITVHKGPQAVLYGSDALGGMIDLKTRKGENPGETRLNLNAGSFGTVDSSLSTDWKNENNNGTLTLLRFHSDGFSRINRKRYKAKEKDATDITQLVSSSEHRWATKFQTDLLAMYLHGKAEQDGYGDDNSYDYGQSDQYVLQQKTNYELGRNQAVSLRSGFNRHQRHIETVSNKDEFFNGNFLQNEVVHRLEAGPLGLLTGVSSEKEMAVSKRMDRSFDLHSVFTQSSVKFEDLRFHAGLRADRHSRYRSFYTGSGGMGFRELSFQYSQGYKAPSLYQLYGDTLANPNLVPETNHFMELSWKKEGDRLDTEISIFQNRLSNLFTYSFSKGYLNQQRFITEGIELNGKIKTTDFIISSGFTHQRFREEEETILRRPLNSAMLSTSYFLQETLELNLTGRWFSSRKDYGEVDIDKINGYEVVDFGVRKTWERDDVGLQVKNILNREYENNYGFSTMPRAVFAHYGHRFY